MKRMMIVIFIIIFSCILMPESFAENGVVDSGIGNASPAKSYSWSGKLKRGTLNIISSPVEIARSIQITSSEGSLLKGWTIGLAEGLAEGCLRLGAGVVDVLT